MLETLRRSYRERDENNFNLTNGFDWDKPQASGKKMLPDERSFKDVLSAIGSSALDIVQRNFTAANSKLPGFWAQVRSIRQIWGGSSEGFTFNVVNRCTLEMLMKASKQFCADCALFQSDHQKPVPRQCYRQLMGALGPGLHVCIVEPGREDASGGPHEIHIDFHQIATSNIAGGKCFYSYILDHMQDVGPHLILDLVIPKLMEVLKRKPIVWGPDARKILEIELKAELGAVADLIRWFPGGEQAVNAVVNRVVELVSMYMDMTNKGGLNPVPCGK
jgi:hypothetical protein